MPELLRIFGLRFFFYSNDHVPPHVHVRNADGEARFTIQPVICIENNGLKNKDIYLAEAIIEENQQIFLSRWNEFFKSSDMKFFEYRASKVWLTSTDIFVELEDGRQACLPIKDLPILFNASSKEREKFEIINGYALYWPDLGEDLSIAGFFEQKDNNDPKCQPISFLTKK